jgi:adenosylhomocysteinase
VASTRQPRDIADAALAEAGETRIEWAAARMPVLRSIAERYQVERPLDGIVISACLHVTTETANLVRTLIAGGAQVALCAANPLSTQDDVAAALAAAGGVEVHAIQGEDVETYYRHIEAVAARGPQLTMDDGADVISLIHAEHPQLAAGIVGGTEATTSGVIRLRALEREGRLAFPVLAVDEAQTTRLFATRYGTGQSTLDGILRATNLLLAGATVVVLGYGECGKGIALRAKGAGAAVAVCEVDPLRALEARMEGFEVLPARDAAPRGDVFITASGCRDVLSREHFEQMRDGAVLCNAGHFDVEIDIEGLRELAVGRRALRDSVERYELADGRGITLLAQGRVVNLAAAEGHPAALMDLSFAIQALAAEHLAAHGAELPARVLGVPAELDREVARLKLAALELEIDELSADQRAYLESWRRGT